MNNELLENMHSSYFSVKLGFRKIYNGPCITQMDHPYNKKLFEANFHHLPTILLFFEDDATKSNRDNSDAIDVVSKSDDEEMCFDLPMQSYSLMRECERNVNFAREAEAPFDIDERIATERPKWNVQQSQLFSRVIKALQNDRLSKLANSEKMNEPIIRRLCVDKTAMRLRKAFSLIRWDKDLLQWINGLLISSLSHSALASYLDALQTIREKMPNAIDRMLEQMFASADSTSSEALHLLLQRPWDPTQKLFSMNELPALTSRPIVIMLTTFSMNSPISNKRARYWAREFAAFSHFIRVSSSEADVNLNFCCAQYQETVDCIQRAAAEYPGHSIVLITWGYTADIACQVIAKHGKVNYVIFISLNLPSTLLSSSDATLVNNEENSSSIEVETSTEFDMFKEIVSWNLPTMFVLGEDSYKNTLQLAEDFKSKIMTAGRLLVVGGANSNLFVTHEKRQHFLATQNLVDRCVIEMIHEYLAICLNKTLYATLTSIEPKEEKQLILQP